MILILNIFFQLDPNRQEETVASLQLAETIVAISCLRQGGHFVLKMFTMFEAESVCLLFLLTSLFGYVNVFKPATSKEANSEVYVVCRDFSGNVDQVQLNKLFAKTNWETSNTVLFQKKDIPHSFLKQVQDCARFFADCQVIILF